jgi:hypothetical protein
MWQDIILILIIAACMFFIGRRIRRQLGENKTGCGCSCSGCDDPSAKTKGCETKTSHTLH